MPRVETEKLPVSFRAAIESFLKERFSLKADKLPADDPKRAELVIQFSREIWIASAAKRVRSIQTVTHSIKAIHPEARGSNFYVNPADMPQIPEVGSHVLGNDFVVDVVGNAASLDVYKFLSLEVGGQSLLLALQENDCEAIGALHDVPDQAEAFKQAFLGISAPMVEQPTTHRSAKQMYWLTGEDPCDDGEFQLLAPLFATSLAQAKHEQIHSDRFGIGNSAARKAFYARAPYDGVYHDYKGLAALHLGGSNQQNVSQLNSARGGLNYLLESLPPVWRGDRTLLPAGVASVFDRAFLATPGVRQSLMVLRRFLASNQPANAKTRDRRTQLVTRLTDELTVFAQAVHKSMPAGWTMRAQFQSLNRAEQLWLDPWRAELADEIEFAQEWLNLEWPAIVGKRFSVWLNSEIFDAVPVGDIEARAWERVLLASDGGFARGIRRLHAGLNVPKGQSKLPEAP